VSLSKGVGRKRGDDVAAVDDSLDAFGFEQPDGLFDVVQIIVGIGDDAEFHR